MKERKSHLLISGFSNNEEFRPTQIGRSLAIPLQDRAAHGQSLFGQFTNVLNQYQARREQQGSSITQDIGVYVEITSADGCELPLDSLDNRDFNLRYCKKVDNHEVALVFIPESRRDAFIPNCSNI